MPERDLDAGASDVAYEWRIVAAMAGRLHALLMEDNPDLIVRNAYLEAGLVHYRCLVNFLCGDYKGNWHPNDMKPADFLGRDWWPPDEELDGTLRGRLPGINQSLQHLSWGRANQVIMWPYGLLAHEAHYTMGLFLADVPTSAPWRSTFVEAQDYAAQVLPPREKWRATAVGPAPARDATRPPP